ncbi:MAG: hypothetical protein ACXWSR_22460 [Bdellovibrionota bacterium]
MKTARVLMILTLCTVAGALRGEDLSTYRGFRLGMSLPGTAKQAGMKPTEARTLHQRPALIQELEWWPQSRSLSDVSKADPVEKGLLCFYNGDLFRIIVTYDSYRVQGMTAEDMIEALSASYGKASKPTTEIANHSLYGEVTPVLARWEDAQYAYNLIRTGDQSSFAMILYSKQLEALAQAAITEAGRLDADEAPQREIQREQVKANEERLALEKARTQNRPNFRP